MNTKTNDDIKEITYEMEDQLPQLRLAVNYLEAVLLEMRKAKSVKDYILIYHGLSHCRGLENMKDMLESYQKGLEKSLDRLSDELDVWEGGEVD